MKIKIAIC